MHDVLKENSLEVTEESLVQLKYDSQSVRGYIEVMSAVEANECFFWFWLPGVC